MKKDVLINLYWILDSVRKGAEPNSQHVGECFIAIRDELMMPDTEDIVAHIYEALGQSRAAADELTDQVIGKSRRRPLADEQMLELLGSMPAVHRMPTDLRADVAVGFGRLIEAAHGIKP